MRLKVDTKIEGDKIIQDTYYEDIHTKLRQDLGRKIIDLQEQGIKEALIALGWTPPKPIDPPSVDFGERIR